MNKVSGQLLGVICGVISFMVMSNTSVLAQQNQGGSPNNVPSRQVRDLHHPYGGSGKANQQTGIFPRFPLLRTSQQSRPLNGQLNSQQPYHERRERMVKSFDKNNDGILDQNERAQMRTYINQHSQQPVQRVRQIGARSNNRQPAN
jgi:hypothetical protein